MDHNDSMDRDHGSRRRRRRGQPCQPIGRRERGNPETLREISPVAAQSAPPPRPPIILSKPLSDQQHVTTPQNVSPSRQKQGEKPVVVLRSGRDEVRATTPIPVSQPSMTLPGDGTPQSPHPMHRHPPGLLPDIPSQMKLNGIPEMTKSIKLIDEFLTWCDAGTDVLLDQTDFLVVGVIGMQGCGKSTLMSLLAGNSQHDLSRNFVFQRQTKETRELGSHQTVGIDLYVTSERIIYLDVQPLLSASVLDRLIHLDRKFPSEYSSVENCIEMQSLQLVTFLMTVCNVLLIAQDWFCDLNFIRFLQIAEMLKPPTPSSGHEGSSGHEDTPTYYPHAVFVQTKCSRENFTKENYKAMVTTLSRLFNKSKLQLRDGLSTASTENITGLNSKTVDSEFNLHLLPPLDTEKIESADTVLSSLPVYRGCPSCETMLKALRRQILCMPRSLITHTMLSEKNWFHYAARIWDAVKKSQLLSEYNRLLP